MLTEKADITHFRHHTLYRMLKLEMIGVKRRGRTAYSIIKQELGFKGNRQKVLDQLKAHLTMKDGKPPITLGEM